MTISAIPALAKLFSNLNQELNINSKLTFSGFYEHFSELMKISSEYRLLVALSGGCDSVALLHLCQKLKRKLGTDVYAVHVNHGLRKASSMEELFVKDLCKKWEIDLEVFYPLRKRGKGESIEMWARGIRYEAYEVARKKFNCNWVLTAHHANDQVETILMHLDAGCSVEGLQGIPTQNNYILRPLLIFSQTSIETYVKDNDLNFVEDKSNWDLSIQRNFIRHEIVNRWFQNTDQLVSRFGELSRQAVDAVIRMDAVISKLANQAVKKENGQILLMDEQFDFLSKKQLVRLTKFIIGENMISWRRHRWETLSQWFRKAKIGSILELNLDWTVLRDRNCWVLIHGDLKPVNLFIDTKGRFGTDGYTLTLNKIESPIINTDPFYEIIDGKAVGGKNLILRSWHKGDIFQPLGMVGHKKVSDFLIDEKVNRFSKMQQLVLTANDEIIWICGRRLGDLAKITDSTTEYLELYLEPGVG